MTSPDASLALACLDLTSLHDDDTPASIVALAQSALTPFGFPASLCVFPRWIATTRKALDACALCNVKIATVVNFPLGMDSPQSVAEQTRTALVLGADEIDVVFNWRALVAGDVQPGVEVVQAARRACDTHRARTILKVILETGELHEAALIRKASDAALNAGADFIKTSTGKAAVNATPEAARIMLEAIRDHAAQTGRSLAQSAGFKAAGGVTTLESACIYIELARSILGPHWVTPDHMRFGASSLLKSLLGALRDNGQNSADATGY